MSSQNITLSTTDEQKMRIDELISENKLLFEQLYIVQEELEKSYQFLNDREQCLNNSNINNSIINASTELNNILISNIKLQYLVEQQKKALYIERTNSLAARLGTTLITGVKSISSFIKLPFKLCRLWKALFQKNPPATLGGKYFSKVLETYKIQGADSVEKLLNSVFISSVMRANAYTELARNIMHTEPKQAAIFARLAWETDPQPYRLKWLAFRTYEAHDIITSGVLLDMLPTDINMNESEKKKSERIQIELKKILSKKASEKINTLIPIFFDKQNKQNKEDYKKQLTETLSILNKQHNTQSLEIIRINNQLTKLKNTAELAKQEASQERKAKITLQYQIDMQKQETEILTHQTANLIKTILSQFETDTKSLSKVLRIVLGSSVNK